MKRVVALLALCLCLAGCHNTKVINGVEYDVYGLANEADKKNPNIEYEISIGSVAAAFLLSETIVVPVYVILVDLYQPVGPKPTITGQVPAE